MAKENGVVAVFSYLDTACEAIRQVKGAGEKFEVYTPFPSHDIDHAIGKGPSAVWAFTFLGTTSGVALGVFLSIWINKTWPIIVAGKPFISLPAFIVVYFELFILLGVLVTLAGLFILAKLPSLKLPASYDTRFSNDKFGIFVQCTDERKAAVAATLKQLGAEETRDVQ